MTSTEPRLNTRRLPPIAGLLDDLVDQAIRVRRRRTMIADAPGQTLAALRTMDDTLDRSVKALRIYGDDAVHALQARQQQSEADVREAVAFLRVALAVQAEAADQAGVAAGLVESHPRAVHEALWFFPAPITPLAERNGHVLPLLDAAEAGAFPLPLALQLAGQRDVRAAAPAIERQRSGPARAAAEYAWAAIGRADEGTRRFVEQGLASGDIVQVAAALEVLAVVPTLAQAPALRACTAEQPPQAVDAAWCLRACLSPQEMLDLARQRQDMPLQMQARVLAMSGDIAAIIELCGALVDSGAPAGPQHADPLLLVLGDLPAECSDTAATAQDRSRALRKLVLRVCRQAHIGVRNDADQAPWVPEAMLHDLAQARSVRLRHGQRMPALPPLDAAVLHLTHGLRQWLYIERALLARHPLSLSAWDVSRRQLLALGVAEVVDELRVR